MCRDSSSISLRLKLRHLHRCTRYHRPSRYHFTHHHIHANKLSSSLPLQGHHNSLILNPNPIPLHTPSVGPLNIPTLHLSSTSSRPQA